VHKYNIFYIQSQEKIKKNLDTFLIYRLHEETINPQKFYEQKDKNPKLLKRIMEFAE